MADIGDEAAHGALVVGDALGHAVEGGGEFADLARPGFGGARFVAALSEIGHDAGQVAQRAHQRAGENYCEQRGGGDAGQAGEDQPCGEVGDRPGGAIVGEGDREQDGVALAEAVNEREQHAAHHRLLGFADAQLGAVPAVGVALLGDSLPGEGGASAAQAELLLEAFEDVAFGVEQEDERVGVLGVVADALGEFAGGLAALDAAADVDRDGVGDGLEFVAVDGLAVAAEQSGEDGCADAEGQRDDEQEAEEEAGSEPDAADALAQPAQHTEGAVKHPPAAFRRRAQLP